MRINYIDELEDIRYFQLANSWVFFFSQKDFKFFKNYFEYLKIFKMFGVFVKMNW